MLIKIQSLPIHQGAGKYAFTVSFDPGPEGWNPKVETGLSSPAVITDITEVGKFVAELLMFGHPDWPRCESMSQHGYLPTKEDIASAVALTNSLIKDKVPEGSTPCQHFFGYHLDGQRCGSAEDCSKRLGVLNP